MEIINLFLIPFSSIAFGGYTWGQVISGIFILSVFWAIIQLDVEIAQLNNQRPSIKIKPIIQSNNQALLKIHNSGARALFTVTMKIIKSDSLSDSKLFEMRWDKGDGFINKDGDGFVLVAQQYYFENYTQIGVKMPYKVMAQSSELDDVDLGYFTLGIWGKDEQSIIKKDSPPKPIYIQITITSEKPPKKSFIDLVFKLSQPTITALEFDYMECKTSKIRLLKHDKEGYLS